MSVRQQGFAHAPVTVVVPCASSEWVQVSNEEWVRVCVRQQGFAHTPATCGCVQTM